MAEGEKGPHRILFSPDGLYITLKQLKESKFADTVCITKIKTPIGEYHVPKEVNGDPLSWDSFKKIIICSDKSELIKNTASTTISYFRSDGKPEKITLTELHKVSHF